MGPNPSDSAPPPVVAPNRLPLASRIRPANGLSPSGHSNTSSSGPQKLTRVVKSAARGWPGAGAATKAAIASNPEMRKFMDPPRQRIGASRQREKADPSILFNITSVGRLVDIRSLGKSGKLTD